MTAFLPDSLPAAGDLLRLHASPGVRSVTDSAGSCWAQARPGEWLTQMDARLHPGDTVCLHFPDGAVVVFCSAAVLVALASPAGWTARAR